MCSNKDASVKQDKVLLSFLVSLKKIYAMKGMKFVYNKFSGVGEQRVPPYPTFKSASGRKTFSLVTQKILPPDAVLPASRHK